MASMGEKAMDVEDAENEVSVASAILNSIASRQNEVLSPEDLFWVDSCLVQDSDISETDWIPLKNALLDIISSQPQSFSTEVEDVNIPPYSISSEFTNAVSTSDRKLDYQSSTSVEHNQRSSTSDAKRLSEPSSTFNVNPLLMAVESSMDEIPDDEETGTSPSLNPFVATFKEHLKENETIDFGPNLVSSTYNVNPLLMAVKSSMDEIPDDEETGTSPSFNPFVATFKEDLKENETIDFGPNLDSSSYEMEDLAENIFKIWDLDIPSEEGELVKQLDKALSENSFQTVPSSFDDSSKLKDMKDSSLDDLIAGIADLSLNKNI